MPTHPADPFSLEVLADPFTFHEALRDAGPVVHLPAIDVYAMGRYTEVHEALTNWQGFVSSDGVGHLSFRNEEPWRPPSLLLEADPPHHDAPRRVVTEVLGPRTLTRLREGWFADARALVDAIVPPGVDSVEIDGQVDLAEVFPLRVFPDAVGLRQEGRENLLPYGNHLFNAFGPPNDLVKQGEPDAPRLLQSIVEQCGRESLAEGGFGAAIWAAADRGEITHDQAPLLVRSLLSAGVDTTVHGLAALLHALSTHPHEYARLQERPQLVRTAFDEAVRLESPVQTFFRTADVDVEIGGTVVPADSKILMYLASANRDPRRWDDPDRFDLTRDPSGHVGFGMGLHQCVGQHIARLESEAVLTALLARVELIEPLPGARLHLNNTLRGWESLPLRLVARRG
ncbi:MAG: cytochrome P450 [Actinomycetales bacterium]|nr:MAG: cytochrome P450 [Actinomycetales bacterium]